MANEKVKDNTEEIRKGEKMIITIDVRTTIKRLMIVILVAFWILSVAKPGIFKDMVNKAKEEKKAETTISKEIVMIEKSSMYIAMFDDSTYVASDDLAGLAEKLSEATGKCFAAEDSKLKMVDGGVISTVDIAVYRR